MERRAIAGWTRLQVLGAVLVSVFCWQRGGMGLCPDRMQVWFSTKAPPPRRARWSGTGRRFWAGATCGRNRVSVINGSFACNDQAKEDTHTLLPQSAAASRAPHALYDDRSVPRPG